jgi:hypothetical protein
MKKALLLLIFPILLSSCAFYKPAKVNTPLLQEKGDGDISINLGTGANVNVSYSPINHIVLMGNYNNAYKSTGGSISSNTGSQKAQWDFSNRQFEAGIGFYNSNLFEKFYIDLIAGYGTGQCGTTSKTSFLGIYFEGYESKLNNHFLQTTFASDLDKKLVIGVGAKVNFLNFYDYSSTDKESGFPKSTYFTNRYQVIFQTFATFRYTPGFIGFESYFGLAFSKESEYFTYRPIDLGVGVNLDIGKFRAHLRDRKKD